MCSSAFIGSINVEMTKRSAMLRAYTAVSRNRTYQRLDSVSMFIHHRICANAGQGLTASPAAVSGMSSRMIPLVSRTHRNTVKYAASDARVYMQNMPLRPTVDNNPGNVVVTMNAVTHWVPAPMARARALIRLGSISPSSTHTTGPQDTPNAKMNKCSATRVICASVAVMTNTPCELWALKMNTAVRIRSVELMTAEPPSSNGRRPNLSTSTIETNVETTSTAPRVTLISNPCCSLKPAAAHRYSPKYMTAFIPEACWKNASAMPSHTIGRKVQAPAARKFDDRGRSFVLTVLRISAIVASGSTLAPHKRRIMSRAAASRPLATR